MNKLVFFLLLILLPSLLLANNNQLPLSDPEYVDEINKSLPPSFELNKASINGKCIFLKLKSAKETNAILKTSEFETLLIGVYEKSKDGNWVRSDVLCFPDHYGKDIVDSVDLMGNGTKFLKVIHDGNTGSGEYQSVLTYVAWHGDKFVPVLMESYTYDSLGSSWETHDKMNFEFKNVGTDKVTALINFKEKNHQETYESVNGDVGKNIDTNNHWIEKLKWNPLNFSFYDPQQIFEELKTAKYKDQIQFLKMRLNFLKKRPDVHKLDYPDLDELGIML
jgi:hypothetical protein